MQPLGSYVFSTQFSFFLSLLRTKFLNKVNKKNKTFTKTFFLLFHTDGLFMQNSKTTFMEILFCFILWNAFFGVWICVY